MAGAGDRLAPEGEMAIIELELVQLRHAIERARRRSHQLGPYPVSGETGNSLDIHSVPPERVIDRFASSRARESRRTSPVRSRRMQRQRLRERNLPLEGENDDDRKNDEPGHEPE